MVRETGLEPAHPCGRQPLKLMRLPISPLAHCRNRYAAASELSTEQFNRTFASSGLILHGNMDVPKISPSGGGVGVLPRVLYSTKRGRYGEGAIFSVCVFRADGSQPDGLFCLFDGLCPAALVDS